MDLLRRRKGTSINVPFPIWYYAASKVPDLEPIVMV